MVENQLTKVYGNTRGIPLTYKSRSKVDERFLNELSRDRHIVLHGGSKQGKSCLRKYHLDKSRYIIIQCTRGYSLESLYEQILKNADIEYQISSQVTSKGNRKISALIEGEGGLPILSKVKGGGGYENIKEKSQSRTYQSIDIDPTEPNDIVRLLRANSFDKLIVLEDFHYLDEELQRQFAFDLKVFHETSELTFIIVAVWQESNRLTVFNGDLSGRIANINVDEWSNSDLKELIESGFELLNIHFPDHIIEMILDASNENVGLVQELCRKICEQSNVWKTQKEHCEIGTPAGVLEAVNSITSEMGARYQTFMGKFCEGLSVTEFEMYKWLMFAIIQSHPDELRRGVSSGILYRKIKDHHPRKNQLQITHLNQALERVYKVQSKHKLQPFILDYSHNELFVVDANFLIFLESKSHSELHKIIEIQI